MANLTTFREATVRLWEPFPLLLLFSLLSTSSGSFVTELASPAPTTRVVPSAVGDGLVVMEPSWLAEERGSPSGIPLAGG